MEDPHIEGDGDTEEEFIIEITSLVASAAAVVCTAAEYHSKYVDKSICRNTYHSHRDFVSRLLESNDDCKHNLRMTIDCFQRFVNIFRESGRLHDTVHCTVEEQIAIFLHTISLNQRNRSISFYMKRSGETVAHYFHMVLDAILDMQKVFIRDPIAETAQQIRNNPRWMPYFQDCIGAIDGTHIPASVSLEYEAKFRGRKQYATQNVLAACDFDLKFTYVLVGWEGSATDSRILADAIHRENPIVCLPGKYYLADAGFPLLCNFITPFRGVRYHLNEVRGRMPQTEVELFNHRHSSLRNHIERAFGVLKKRFNIINAVPKYPYQMQVDIVMACCCIHNHIRTVMPDDYLLQAVDRELLEQSMNREPEPDVHIVQHLSRVAEAREGTRIRTVIMRQMWVDYRRRQRNLH